jgi:pantetheine-phosphate adenylyltransferase
LIFAKVLTPRYMIRGIRTVSDFEYEKAIAQMNHALAPDIESIFIVSKPGYSSISSTIVREILKYGRRCKPVYPYCGAAVSCKQVNFFQHVHNRWESIGLR